MLKKMAVEELKLEEWFPLSLLDLSDQHRD